MATINRFSVAKQTSSGSSAAAAFELRAPTKGFLLRELGISLAAATASEFGLGRPAAIGITPTSPVTVLAENPNTATGTAAAAVAWGTGPTVPANFLRRVSFPATIGSLIVWTFEKGLMIPAGGSIVVWNLAANGVADIWAMGEE